MPHSSSLTSVNADGPTRANSYAMERFCDHSGNGGSVDNKLAAVTLGLQTRGEVVEELRETSMAWVFLTRHHVYKMKKPIRRRIFDFRTLASRHHACREEVRLNRRLAPDVYLGLTRLARSKGGPLILDGPGRTVEWLVRLRRLPADRFLDQVIATGKPRREEIVVLTDLLTRFHAERAVATVDRQTYIDRYRDELIGIRSLLPNPVFAETARRFGRLCDLLETLLNRASEVIPERLAKGKVVDGHGDLRPEHVWLGPPVLIIDSLEAAPAFRALDPFEEYATLAMECAVLGADWIGPALLTRAAAALGDNPGARLLAFYTAFRATLRARQALAHLLDPSPRTPGKWGPQADRYLIEAERAAAILENAKVR